MSTITERLAALRAAMKAHGVQAVILPTSDYHDTEYVCDYFKARTYFSGFTGSAGTLAVLENAAALWTDGRYYIQAGRELEGSGIELMKDGLETTPTISQYLLDHLKAGDTVAFDGRCISMADYDKYQKVLGAHDIKVDPALDLAGEAWPERPALPATETFVLEDQYTGESVASKLKRVREAMREAGADAHITTKIDEVAWLFNIRAHDIPSFPVALAYALITPDAARIYIDDSRLDAQSRSLLEENSVEIRPYNAIYDDAKAVEGAVLMDRDFANSRLGTDVPEPLWKGNPMQMMKAVKNPVEVEGAFQAHRRDGAAVVEFWKWLEEAMKKGEPVTEISAADYLHGCRAKQKDFVEDSFSTISACGANASMPHYHPDEVHPVPLVSEGLFLVDSGGHYLDGTTDITRTFVMGPLSDEEKNAFTRVLQGHIDLARAVFAKGARGLNLDILARQPMWLDGMDYNHGTGHGVGHMLSVHEGPNGIRWKIVPERKDSAPLVPGMITSNEPGCYEEGKFGIRHENLMVTVPAFGTENGEFYRHEALTRVPFDVRGLDLSLMSQEQIDWLNDYHARVYEDLKDLLDKPTAAWLKEKTAPVSK